MTGDFVEIQGYKKLEFAKVIVFGDKYGLLAKHKLLQIIDLELAATAYSKPNQMYKDSKWNGRTLSWKDICLAEEDAEPIERPECSPGAHASPLEPYRQAYRASLAKGKDPEAAEVALSELEFALGFKKFMDETT